MARQDTALLEALLGYQQEAVQAYALALDRAPLEPGDRPVLQRLAGEATESAVALRKAVVKAGGSPVAPSSPSPATLPPALAGKPGREDYLDYIVASEEAAVNGYYVSLQALASLKLVRGVAAFMSAGGRRLVAVRELAGDPLVPHAFETGGA